MRNRMKSEHGGLNKREEAGKWRKGFHDKVNGEEKSVVERKKTVMTKRKKKKRKHDEEK